MAERAAPRNPRTLAERLARAGVIPGDDPFAAWTRLRETEGPRATVIELYELVATPRGLAPHELATGERRELVRKMAPIVWPGFEVVPGSDRGPEPVEVLPYDSSWPQRYASWRGRFLAHLGAAALRIEHVGSTSVPGLAAKPTVDIQVSVADILDEKAYVPALERAGVQLRSRDALHRFFRPFAGQPRDVHVHICNAGSVWEEEHVLFRDYLRAQADARRRYATAKQRAAIVWHDDRWAYTDAKSGVILDLVQEARAFFTGASG